MTTMAGDQGAEDGAGRTCCQPFAGWNATSTSIASYTGLTARSRSPYPCGRGGQLSVAPSGLAAARRGSSVVEDMNGDFSDGYCPLPLSAKRLQQGVIGRRRTWMAPTRARPNLTIERALTSSACCSRVSLRRCLTLQDGGDASCEHGGSSSRPERSTRQRFSCVPGSDRPSTSSL